MTREEYSAFIAKVAPENARYIMCCEEITGGFERAERYRKDGKLELADMVEQRVIERITTFNRTALTPATVKVGDGVTINLWSDRHAATVIKVTAKTVTVCRDKATLNPDFKPEFTPGGFAAHCTNQSEQSYTYEPDEKGEVRTFHWSDKFQRYGQPGNLTLSKGRHEFYDYNF